jgi:hypothetical protein
VFRPWLQSNLGEVSIDAEAQFRGLVVDAYGAVARVSYVLDCCRSCVPPSGYIGFSQGIEQDWIVVEPVTAQDSLGSSF